MSSKLRALVADVELRLGAAAPVEDGADRAGLIAAWRSLVEALDLAPEPEVRPCPRCARAIRSSATLCGFCWTRVEPSRS